MRIPAPGEFFQSKYEVTEVLGQGGFATVLRATDIEVGREVAIKVLSPKQGADAQTRARFMREARVIASLQDAHTITMFEFGETPEGLLFMVFEYVRGRDLKEVIRIRGPLPPGVVEHILRQTLSALEEAHQKGILHRDIKPANIIVSEYMDDPWRVTLIDFGIAKPITNVGRDYTKLTQDGAVIGTPRYMAPEQFFGEDLTARADIYSLGLVSYELLVGEPAIAGNNSQELMRRAVSPDPIQIPPIPSAPGLARVIARMVEREPSDRFATVAAVLAALDAGGRISAEQSGPTSPPPPIEPQYAPGVAPARYPSDRATAPRTAPPGQRDVGTTSWRPWIAMSLGVASVAVVALAAWMISSRDAQPAARQAVSPPGGRVELGRAPPFVRGATPEVQAEPIVDVGEAPSAADAGQPARSDGCGEPLDWRGPRTRRVQIGFQSRTYTVYVPRLYEESRRHGTVLIFHNALRDGRTTIENTEFDRIAERENLVLVAPDSLGATRPWFGIDDVELTRVALEDARKLLCLDPARVYALGHGGGGNYAARLRCEMEFSAFAATSAGEYDTEQICSAAPVPFIRMYGLHDRHVPADGGSGCYDKSHFRSADEIARQWRDRSGGRGRGETWFKKGDSVCTLWRGEAAFVSCGLDGGHDWPTAPAKFEIPGCQAPPPEFPIGETIWRFFDEFGQPIEAGATGAADMD